MTITDIANNIASLGDAHRETMALITKLRKLEGIGVDAARLELVNLIHQSLKDSEQDLELLRVQIEDLPAGEQKTSLTSKWHKLSEDTKIARVSYRKAQIEAKKNAEAARRKEREKLLGTGADGKRRLRGANQLAQEELVLNASSDITSSLRRSHALLSSELSRSQFASETLEASTQALKELSTRYSAFDDLLLKSRRLITDLVRKNKSDAWYYEKAIYIMLATVIWLIVRRFLYGPIYLFIWLPLKLCWWLLSMAALLIGAGGGHDSEIVRGGDSLHVVEDPTVTSTPKLEVTGIAKDIANAPGPQPEPQSQTLDVDKGTTGENWNCYARPLSPFNENESLLEKVGEAIGRQREFEVSRLQVGRDILHNEARAHDEL
ncbi:Sec20-domain-containing protein [Kalaharituber pfeilii]|nr:Sec20-domain-containing protein [Kalaharituber pfeilii]